MISLGSAWLVLAAHGKNSCDGLQAPRKANCATQAALRKLDREISVHPLQVDLYELRANLKKKAGMQEDAKADLIAALNCLDAKIADQPMDAALYDKRGQIKQRAGRTRESLTDFDKAIAIAPVNALFYCHRADVFIDLTMPDRALVDCNRAIDLDPRFASAYYLRGRAWFLKELFSKAISDLTKAILLQQKKPKDNFYQMRGRALTSVRRWQDADKDFIAALTINNSDAHLYYLHGVALFELGDLNGSRKALTRATVLDPGCSEAYATRGQLYDRRGDPVQALRDFTTASRLNKNMDRLLAPEMERLRQRINSERQSKHAHSR